MYFSDSPFYLKEDSDMFGDGVPVRITSGFGGLGLIDFELFLKCKWSSTHTSEHVNFCFDIINSGGSIFVDPRSTPFSHTDLSTLNLDRCKQIAKSQFENFILLNQNYLKSLS